MPKWNRVTRHNTRITYDNVGRIVTYHTTAIVRHNTLQGVITLNSGGWQTVTTKVRMNQYAHEFANGAYSVYQQKGVWYVRIHTGPQAGQTVDFFDGMEIKL